MSRRGPKGFSLFWRTSRQRWVLSYPAGGKSWTQHILPATFTKADRAGAKTYAESFLANAPAPQPPVDPGGATWAQLAERWLPMRRARGVKGSTMLDTRSHLSVHILPAFGADPAAALATSIPKVRAWLRELRGRLSPSRIRGVVSTFRSLVDDAIAEEWVRFAGNPLRSTAVDAEIPALPTLPVVTVPLDHVQVILNAATKLPLDWRVRCAIGFGAGLSDGEIAGLRWADVDLSGDVPTLRVSQAVALQEDGKQKVGTTKRPQRVRTVPMHPAVAAALTEWRSAGAPVLLHRDPLPTDLVLCGPGGAVTRPSAADKLRRTLEALGLPSKHPSGQRLTFQASRRTFLTALEAAGVSLERRQRLAGHAKGTVTEHHYTAGDMRAMAEDVARVPLTWPVSDLVSAVTSDGGSGSDSMVPITRNAGRKRIRKPLLYPLSYGGDGDGRGKLAPGDTTANGLDAGSGFGTGAFVVPGTTPRVSAEIAKLAADLSMAAAFDRAIGAACHNDAPGVATALAMVARMNGREDVADLLSPPSAACGARGVG